MGRGCEKKTESEKETKEKNPRLVVLPSPLLRYGGRLFSGVRERRKQAGPTLSGRGSNLMGKKKKALTTDSLSGLQSSIVSLLEESIVHRE